MKDGFIKIACATPELRVADCKFNCQKICKLIKTAADKGTALCIFPELCITGYTCGDLFFQNALLNSAVENLENILNFSKNLNTISIIGLPVHKDGKIYNSAAVIYNGSILGISLKKNLPNYGEFYEARQFTPGFKTGTIDICGQKNVPIGTDYIYKCTNMSEFKFGIEICEDLWVGDSPSVDLAKEGAVLIANPSASNEIIGKAEYRRTIVKAESGSLLCIYAYANTGIGESTTDMVYSGHSIISENGALVKESEKFSSGIITYDADFQKMEAERRKSNTFHNSNQNKSSAFTPIEFSFKTFETNLTNKIPQKPFVPESRNALNSRCSEILTIQAVGLMTRFKHTGCKSAVIGLSGGLDSTLALIVTVKAFHMLGYDLKGITAVTMPCFGTTDRTYNNACRLAELFGATLREIKIKDSVMLHFKDIGHDERIHDITYENSQARERTQILMDIANQTNGMVIGTGDLSELALGWATYNGDHMSMYAVNASIPKTLVKHLVGYEACNSKGEIKNILYDILDTPVSPELLPPDNNGTISQKTEDIVGPYELHDFFLYYMLRYGFLPSKILRLAMKAFNGVYDRSVILKWEKVFYKRFFSQQFKRSCIPDGPKVGSVTLSPRSDLRMPSDASSRIWLEEIDNLINAG